MWKSEPTILVFHLQGPQEFKTQNDIDSETKMKEPKEPNLDKAEEIDNPNTNIIKIHHSLFVRTDNIVIILIVIFQDGEMRR